MVSFIAEGAVAATGSILPLWWRNVCGSTATGNLKRVSSRHNNSVAGPDQQGALWRCGTASTGLSSGRGEAEVVDEGDSLGVEKEQVDDDTDVLDSVMLYLNAFMAVYTTATKLN